MLSLNQSNPNSHSTLKPWKSPPVVLLSSSVAIVLLFILLSSFSWNQDSGDSPSNTISSPLRRMTGDLQLQLLSQTLDVFMAYSDSPVARKKLKDFGANDGLRVVVSNPQEQMTYFELNGCVDNALERYQAFVKQEQPHLAQELWKFCVLSHHGGLYVDAESPLLVSVDEIRNLNRNVAITSDYFETTIHGAILLLKDGHVAQQMAQVLVDTPISTLIESPLIVAQTLYQIIHDKDSSMSQWHLYRHSCVTNALSGRKLSSYSLTNRLAHFCPLDAGYCCQVLDSQTVVMMTKHPILPNQILPETLPLSYNPSSDGDESDEDLPYIATIQATTYTRPDNAPKTPNFFDTLLQNNCLPSDLQCSMCLRDKKGADCKKCKDLCPCYCKTLCKVSVDQKFISKELAISSPRFARDPTRLVPRIIHQTWFETVTPEKYPNMSRLIESFKQSGWEYKFYDDDSSRRLLKKHFPPEVLQAYDALKPGAFKADLFRYCVLLIYGGIYADMDVLLESNLDAAVGPDVGFMVPVDEPGTPVGKRMCLWNGFIASAPAHPFLAKAIETVVNNVRNRFTSVDVDATFCPDPELSVLHAFDTLFTAGPCILGSVVNKVMGRHGQTQFEPGQMDPEVSTAIPGRTIILKQNKWDMGAHRFTLLEKNLVVAATDMPDYDDRDKLQDKEHYSKTHVKTGIYGLEKLYTDNKKANEDIKLIVV